MLNKQELPEENQTAAKYVEEAEKLEKQQSWSEAAEYYRKAIKIKPKEATVYEKLAQVLQKMGDKEGASLYLKLANLRKGGEKKTDSQGEEKKQENINLEAGKTYLEQSEEYYQKQEWEKVIKACEAAIKINPQLAEAYKIWGNALQQKGEITTAVKCYVKALEIQPEYVEVYGNLGSLYAKQKQWEEAIQYYQKAIEYDPKFVGAYRNLQKVWSALGETQKAAECKLQVLLLEPEKATAEDFFNLGEEFWLEGNLKTARECYEQARKLKPNWSEVQQKLAEILERQGEKEKAASHPGVEVQGVKETPVKETLRVLVEAQREEVSPTAEELVRLGNAYGEQEKWDEAIQCYRQAVKIGYENKAMVYEKLAQAYKKQGRLEAAVSYIKMAITTKTNNETTRVKTQENPNSETAKIYLEQGEAYYKKQKWDKVINACETAIKINPQLAEAYKMWGNALLQQGETKKATECYVKALEIKPGYVEIYANLGSLYAKQQQWEEAIQYYQKAIEYDPKFVGAYRNLQKVWSALGESQKAAACRRKILLIEPEGGTPGEYLNLGDELRVEGKLEEAAECCRKAIKINPNWAQAHQKLAEILEQQGKWQEAASHYRQAMQVVGKTQTLLTGTQEENKPVLSTTGELVKQQTETAQISPEELVKLGNIYAEQRKWEQAINCYQKAIAINPKIAAAYSNLAKVLTQIGQSEKAAEYWYLALSLEPNWAGAQEYLKLGFSLEKQGKIEQAENCYRRAIQLDSSLVQAYLRFGELLSKQGKENAAISCWYQGVSKNPQSPELNFTIGLALTAQQKWEEAREYYQKTIELQPENWQAYHNLGNALQEEQKWEEAARTYKKVIEINPEFSWAYNNLGDTLREMKLWEEAATAYQETTRKNPQFAWAHYNLGDMLVEIGAIEKAIAAYKQALKVQPNFPQAEEKLNQTLLQRMKLGLKKAKEYYQQQLQINPKDGISYEYIVQIEPDNLEMVVGLGNALIETGKIKEAIAPLEKAIKIKPDLALGYQKLGEILAEIGKEEKAAEYQLEAFKLEPKWRSAQGYLKLGNKFWEQEKLEQAESCYRQVLELENDPEVEVYQHLGEILSKQKKWQEAGEIYNLGLGKYPQNAELYYHLGETWANRQQWEEASKYYQQAVKNNPKYLAAYESWGIALGKLQNWELATRVYKQALKLNQKLPANYYFNIGTALCYQQKWEEAYQCLLYVGELQPDFWEVNQEKIPLDIIKYLEKILPDKREEIYPLVIAMAKNSQISNSSEFCQLCQRLRENINVAKLTLEYGRWLTPSIAYIECKVQETWVFGQAKVLLFSKNNCAVGEANFFQISDKEIAAAIIFPRQIVQIEQDIYSLIVWWNNKPITIDKTLGEKAYSLEFVQRLNQMSEHQKHLIKENVNRTLVELTPETVKQEVKELLEKHAYYIKENPSTPLNYDLPFNIFIDIVIPIKDDGLFIAGWLQDPYKSLIEIEAISSLGFSLIFREQIYSYERPDVKEHIKNTRYGKFEEKLGFCAYQEVEENIRKKIKDFAQLHGWRFKIKLKGGIVLENIPDIKYQDVNWARELIVKLVPVAQVSPEMLENCLGPAAYKLQKLCIEQVAEKEVKVIGKPVENPLVSIVIPLYKRLDFLKVQFATMANDPTIKEQCELIYVLDSPEQERELKEFLLDHCVLYEMPVTLVIMKRNSGYAAANNRGVNQAKGEYLVLMNSDVFPKTKGWAIKMAEFYASSPKIGTLAPKLIYEDNSLQHAGMYFSHTKFPFWITLHYYKGFPNSYPPAQISRKVPAVTGACLMIKKELYQQVGGLSTDYVIGDFEDSDLCLKCSQLGYQSWYYADAELYHLERQSVPLNSVYADSLAWQYNARLHTKRWENLIGELMEQKQ